MTDNDTILVVDDTRADLKLLVDILCEAGYHVCPAESGELALSSVNATRPALILLDIRMPGMDGFAVCRQLKAREETRDIPIIFISDATEVEKRVEGFQLGAVAFLARPFPKDELLAHVNTHLALRQAHAHLKRQRVDFASINAQLHAEIEKRKQAEEALKLHKIILATQQECSLDGILVVDEQGGLFSCNRRFIDLWGIPADIVTSKSDECALLSVMDKQSISDEFSKKVRYLSEENHETSLDEITLKDGRMFDRYSAPMLDATGKYYGRVWYFHDITERKHTEASILHLASFPEMNPNPVIEIDLQGNLIYENPASAAAFPDLQTRFLQHPVLAGVVSLPNEFTRTGQTRLIREIMVDGLFFLQTIHYQPNFGVIRIYLLDVTKRKQAEAQRVDLEKQIRRQQRLEIVGKLAAGVAHDFNNLLTGITGFTRFAHDALPADAVVREDLAEVLTLAGRASELTRQLLAFSRRQTLQPIILNINQHIDEMIKMLGRLIGEQIDLVFHPAADLGTVEADPGQIEQVLVNLAINARDAMPDGGKLTIETANVWLDEDYTGVHIGALPGPHVMLAVTDNGCGMEASTIEHIFEPFFSTKGVGKGTGLGLATVYGIVKQHGGNIWVYSEPGKGTTFKVYLPQITETIEEPTASRPEELPPSTETILIVEDEDAVCKITARILEQQGYHVLTAALPSLADEILAAHGEKIALLLTDVVMPERSGRKLYESAQARYPHLRVLYMSGYTDNAIVHQGVLDVGTPFIQKPFTAEALLRLVREVLEGTRNDP